MTTATLNNQQRAALDAAESAQTHGGAVFCLAAPGSGKTLTLATAVAACSTDHSLQDGARWHRVLALTFTRHAAFELRQRVEAMTAHINKRRGDLSAPVDIGTFHAICYDLVCRYHQHVGWGGYKSPHITVYDNADRRALIKELLLHAPRASGITQSQLMRALDCLSQTGLWPSDADKRMIELGQLYLQTLVEHNAIDYPTVPYFAYTLIEAGHDVERWQHIFVDEAQDLDWLQHKILEDLQPKSIFFVGDPDQLIYGFRGAAPAILDRAMWTYQGVCNPKIYRLDINYRNPPRVIEAANALIRHNKHRIDKAMVGDPVGAPYSSPQLVGVPAEQLVAEIADHVKHDAGIAVLARTHLVAQRYYDMLRAAGLPVRLIGRRERLLEREDVKTVLAFLAFEEHGANPKTWERIGRALGLSQADVELVRAEAKRGGRTLYEAACARSSKLAAFYQGWMTPVNEPLSRTAKPLNTWSLSERLAATLALVRTLTGSLSSADDADLIAMLGDYVRTEKWSNRTPGRFVGWLAMRDAQDDVRAHAGTSLASGGAGGVEVMTMHAAKGLEFRYVFLVGLTDDLIPHERSHEDHGGDPAALEEKRRLFYMALTRARRRAVFEIPSYGTPSRFLQETVAP